MLSKNVLTNVISSPRHLATSCRFGNQANLETLEEVLTKLGVSWQLANDIDNDKDIANLINPDTFGISIGSPWIFSSSFIKQLNGRFVNVHPAKLPVDRGGGGFSWRVMMENRSSAAVVHLMEPEIDSGDILDMETYTIANSHKKPEEWERFTSKLEEDLLKRFLGVLLSGGTFRRIKQDESMSTYWPRLNTDLQGYIDWSWSRKEIISFVHSFDDPYEGASTFVGNDRVRVKSVFEVNGDGNFHPFQTGLIYRKTKDGLFVATKDGGIMFGKVLDYQGRNIGDQKIKLGDRFYTPTSIIDEVKRNRVYYSPEGLRS